MSGKILRFLWMTPALFATMAAADGNLRDLQAYRTKAAIDTVCPRVGGKITYTKTGPKCELPQVVKKTKEATQEVTGKPLPFSIPH